MSREKRVVIRCDVDLDRLGRRFHAESEDLSRHGLFLRTREVIDPGLTAKLSIQLPSGVVVVAVARAVHQLSPAAAEQLGRYPGIGFSFREFEGGGREQLTGYLERLNDGHKADAPRLPGAKRRAVVADPRPPLLQRLRNAMVEAGFETEVCSTGAQVFDACRQAAPEVVVAAVDLPGLSGVELLAKLKDDRAMATIPVVLIAGDLTDLSRLEAYRLGVDDVVPKPFTDEELRLRVERVLVGADASRGEPVLRGSIAEISVATLLSLFEFERKSGILQVKRDHQKVRLFVSAGQLVKVEDPPPLVSPAASDSGAGPAPLGGNSGGLEVPSGGPMTQIMNLLDWRAGRFEFNPCEVIASDEVGLRTQQILLEHARIRDEASGNTGE